MAYIVPSDLTRLALSGAHSRELETLRALKEQLPADYTVFHGVHWTREYQGWTVFGEIDFVVLNRSGEVLFIEQKNGSLEETEQGLVKRYDEGATNVATQLHRSLDRVRQKFQWQHGKDRSLEVDYLLFFPDHRLRSLSAVGLDESRVVDSRARDHLAQRIHASLGPGIDAGDGWYQKVHDFFCQTFEVVPDIHARVSAHEKSFVRQAGGLASVLANLEMSPFRLRVTAKAGSGKSLVARGFFDREVGRGKRVLFVCYNRLLADQIRQLVGGRGYVNTWYGLCHAFLESRGRSLDFSRITPDAGFWQEVQDRVTAEPIPDEWLFDAMVVDEGQDFEQEWLEILKFFLHDRADILWLEDPNQNLQAKAPVILDEGFVGYRWAVNYRSPQSIARFILDTLPFGFEPGNDLPGTGVGVHAYADSSEQPKIVARVIQGLLRRGFTYDDIRVLTCRGVHGSVFSTLDAVGGVSLRRVTAEYDQDGNQVFTEGRLVFDSVRRFKGQEAPAIILVDVDPRPDRIAEEQRVLYCGMTRATVRLEMAVQSSNPANSGFF